MSREAPSYVSLLLCATIIVSAECTSIRDGVRDRCLELIRFDVDEIEDHLAKLNLADVPTVKMMTAGFKCPTSALPFGTLKSDWARLLLLQEAQPAGSIIKLKLVRLMRILIIAYYQMEERIDVTSPEAKATTKALVAETTTSQSHCPSSSNSLGAAETSSGNAKRHCSCTDSFRNNVTRLAAKNDCSRIRSNATVIEIATTKSFSDPNGTATAVVPPNATRQDVTLSSDPSAISTYYPDSAKKAALRVLGSCLKRTLTDVARQRSIKEFEIAKNKTRYIEHGARKGNEIDDHEKHRIVTRISLPVNEFWRYVTFPTRAPLIVDRAAPAYRMRGLSGLGTGPRKSRERMKLNNDIYEGFRRFYGVDRNEGSTK